MTYHSQNDEERVITEFFGDRKGNFLDIGAYDGLQMSNTRRLLERGWAGVLVEPMWTSFKKLCENCRAYQERVRLVMAAVGPTRSIRRLWVDRTDMREWSTTVNDELKESGSVRQPDELLTYVSTVLLQELLDGFGPFEFVSMDAEWEDLSILMRTSTADWKHTELLCVEYRNNQEKPAVQGCLTKLGFSTIYESKENLIAKNERIAG